MHRRYVPTASWWNSLWIKLSQSWLYQSMGAHWSTIPSGLFTIISYYSYHIVICWRWKGYWNGCKNIGGYPPWIFHWRVSWWCHLSKGLINYFIINSLIIYRRRIEDLCSQHVMTHIRWIWGQISNQVITSFISISYFIIFN